MSVDDHKYLNLDVARVMTARDDIQTIDDLTYVERDAFKGLGYTIDFHMWDVYEEQRGDR